MLQAPLTTYANGLQLEVLDTAGAEQFTAFNEVYIKVSHLPQVCESPTLSAKSLMPRSPSPEWASSWSSGRSSVLIIMGADRLAVGIS